MSKSYCYHTTRFMHSIHHLDYLPSDYGVEIAFLGRSNAGKSSMLNILTEQKHLAKVSKKPGCTKLINLFEVAPTIRLIDMPGYGYARVPDKIVHKLQHALKLYLQQRNSLKGIVILMDIRHPMTVFDKQIIQWATNFNIPILALLSKADKLTFRERKMTLYKIREIMFKLIGNVQVEVFSSLKKQGIKILRKQLDDWFNATLPEK